MRSSTSTLFRNLTRLSVFLPFALLAAVSCDDVEPGNVDNGAAGTTASGGKSGAGGAGGAHGIGGGGAGGGSAGAAGHAGSSQGGASGAGGSAGSAGANGGSAGDTGTAGSGGSAGDTGSAGSAGAAGAMTAVAPTVVANLPVNGATSVDILPVISATFSEAMDPLTINDATFTLQQGATPVMGTVTYLGTIATFTPTAPLAFSTSYTATITTGAKNLAGTPLAAAYTWSFTTRAATALGPSPVPLNSAGNFTILAETAITNVPTSMIKGDMGISSNTTAGITGFALLGAATNTFWTSMQVDGRVFGADNAEPTPTMLTNAIIDMGKAYMDAAGRPPPNLLNVGSGEIGGLTLVPGLYNWNTGVTVSTDVTLAGAPDDVWIFQIAGNLTMASGTAMKLTGGARAKNIFWQVSGIAALGTTAQAEGILLSKTQITLGTGAKVTGRLLAQTQVTLESNTVTAPAP